MARIQIAAKKARRRPVLPAWGNENAQDERRAIILNEAAGCFNRKGYHGTTIEDIADRVNVTKAALYYYFKNKEEILYECHRTALDLGIEALRVATASHSEPDEQLLVVLRHYIEGVTNRLQGTVVLLEEGMLSGERYKIIVKRRDELEKAFRAIVQAGIDQGIFVKCDPKLATFAMLGACNWISKWYSPDGDISSAEIARFFSDYLVNGLRLEASPRLDRRRELSKRRP